MTIVGILIAAVADFILGAVWYGVFGKVWIKEIGRKKEDWNPKNPMPYIVTFGASLVIAFVLFRVQNAMHTGNLTAAIRLGFGVWVGFAAGTAIKHYQFAGRSMRLFAIDYGLDLVSLVVMSELIYLLT
jgi:hypothetical protein